MRKKKLLEGLLLEETCRVGEWHGKARTVGPFKRKHLDINIQNICIKRLQSM